MKSGRQCFFSLHTKNKLFAFFELIRLPNLFTAAADVMAGIFIVCGMQAPGKSFFALFLCSSCIYAGGCVLNDLCDLEKDARERPQRPLPSGRITPAQAWFLLVLLFALGLFGAFLAGWKAFTMAVILILLVVSYDAWAKNRETWGPAAMGACRSLNLLLGMSLGPLSAGITLFFPVLHFVYVFSLTTLSRFEVTGNPQGKRRVVFGGWLLVVAVLLAMCFAGSISGDALWFLVLLTLLTGLPLVTSLLQTQAEDVGKAVGMMIICLPLLDAVYVAGTRGWAYGLPVALLGPAAWMLGRHFYVT